MVSRGDKGLRKQGLLKGSSHVPSVATSSHATGTEDKESLRSQQELAVVREVLFRLRTLFAGSWGEITPMTPERVVAIRKKCQLSQSGLARVLRLGSSGKRTVARWEEPGGTVPGPVSVALEALEDGWRPGDGGWQATRPEYLAILDAIETAVRDVVQDARLRVEHHAEASSDGSVERSGNDDE